MFRSFPIVAVLLILAGCQSGGTPGTTKARPEDVLQNWTRALESGDTGEILAFYGDSDEVVVIHSMGLRRRGPDEIRADFVRDLQVVAYDEAALDVTAVERSGDVAWTTGHLLVRMHGKADGVRRVLEVYISHVLRYDGGQWRIVFEQSTPIDGIPRVRPDDD